MSDEIEKFKAWALTCDGNCSDTDLRRYDAGHPNRVFDGCEFINQEVERDWLVWQAASAELIDRLKKAEAERDELRKQLDWSGGAPVDWGDIPIPGYWAATWPPLQQMSYIQGYRGAIAAMREQKPTGWLTGYGTGQREIWKLLNPDNS